MIYLYEKLLGNNDSNYHNNKCNQAMYRASKQNFITKSYIYCLKNNKL